jgi:hypothetical protein
MDLMLKIILMKIKYQMYLNQILYKMLMMDRLAVMVDIVGRILVLEVEIKDHRS